MKLNHGWLVAILLDSSWPRAVKSLEIPALVGKPAVSLESDVWIRPPVDNHVGFSLKSLLDLHRDAETAQTPVSTSTQVQDWLHVVSNHAYLWVTRPGFRGDWNTLFRRDRLSTLTDMSILKGNHPSYKSYEGQNSLALVLIPCWISTYTSLEAVDETRTNDVTIFAQLSLNRIHMLKDLFLSWRGPINIVLFVEDPADLNHQELMNGSNPMPDLHRVLQRSSHRKIDIHLVFGLAFTTSPGVSHHFYDVMYPINFLRNVAQLLCRTDLVFGIDVDFVPSSGLYESLVFNSTWLADLLAPPLVDPVTERIIQFPNVLIVPAFQHLTSSPFGSSIFWDRHRLLNECKAGHVIPFHANPVANSGSIADRVQAWCLGASSVSPHFHDTKVQGATDFRKWLSIALGVAETQGMLAYFYSHEIHDNSISLLEAAVVLMGSNDEYRSWLNRIQVDNIYQLNRVGRSSIHGDLNETLLLSSETLFRLFRIKVNIHYEPYIVGHKATLGWYWSDFRGYSFNKREHIIELQYRYTAFFVHPTEFIIHRLHTESLASSIWRKRTNLESNLHLDTSTMKNSLIRVVKRAFQVFLDRVRQIDPLEPWRLQIDSVEEETTQFKGDTASPILGDDGTPNPDSDGAFVEVITESSGSTEDTVNSDVNSGSTSVTVESNNDSGSSDERAESNNTDQSKPHQSRQNQESGSEGQHSKKMNVQPPLESESGQNQENQEPGQPSKIPTTFSLKESLETVSSPREDNQDALFEDRVTHFLLQLYSCSLDEFL